MQNPKLVGALALLPVTALVLAGCASGTDADAGASGGGDAAVTIVASTDVYADVARAVAGDGVDVQAIIEGSAQDPHSYEASARDQLAISEADIVIENGGGYDPFIDTLVEASGTGAAVLSASELSGLISGEEGEAHSHAEEDHAHEEGDAHAEEEHGHEGHEHIEGFNEHVWYSFTAIDAVAHELVHVLGDLDADRADEFHQNYEALSAELTSLEERAAGIAASGSVAITEPVPLYLLEAVGLENVTPEDFSEAIEEGNDVPPSSLAATLALFETGDVALLAYNEQTSSPETEQVRAAAEAAGVPVVDFTETLPEGDDYVSWMTANLDAIEEALAA
jgi:zinc/manganese transport system substrate-binding protein